ncbi:MAG: hypothetical protein QNL88_09900 [Acidobacteriota bacterium]|nr:hypothetical protein [Acidobacteriota bacterium]
MWATSDGPRIEDFGITEEDLARAPGLFVADHRFAILGLAYLIAAAALFTAILRVGNSWAAALFFTVVAIAAGSILLLPLVVAALCAGEQAEERWLCRRVPALRACLAYRKAVADHTRHTASELTRHSPAPEEWAVLSPGVFRAEVASLLEQSVAAAVFRCDREATGIDFRVDWTDRCVILRCEAGLQPISAGVGRELTAALTEFEADSAVILSVSGPDPGLARYITKRSIMVLPPWELTASTVMSKTTDAT